MIEPLGIRLRRRSAPAAALPDVFDRDGLGAVTIAVPLGATSAWVAASLVPLISPIVMFTRLVVSELPAWQTALSIALNLAALGAIVPFTGRVYRVGMLLYGSAPKLSQIWAVLRS